MGFARTLAVIEVAKRQQSDLQEKTPARRSPTARSGPSERKITLKWLGCPVYRPFVTNSFGSQLREKMRIASLDVGRLRCLYVPDSAGRPMLVLDSTAVITAWSLRQTWQIRIEISKTKWASWIENWSWSGLTFANCDSNHTGMLMVAAIQNIPRRCGTFISIENSLYKISLC